MPAAGTEVSSPGRLGVLQCAATGATVAALFFALCWVGAALGMLNVSHMYIALFTTEPVDSPLALIIGLSWSVAFGLLAGGLTAAVYNTLGFLSPR